MNFHHKDTKITKGTLPLCVFVSLWSKKLLAVLLLVFGVAALAGDRALPAKSVITIGRATIDPAREQKILEPLAGYLASKLKDVGITRGDVVLASDNRDTTVIQYLKEGKLDIVLEAGLAAYRYKIAANATPILLSLAAGGTSYSSYIFVRKDSGIASLEHLKGKVIAFNDGRSAGGYLLPRLSAEARGIKFSPLSSPDSLVPRGTIGYVFAGPDINIATWVYYRKVDAGTMSSLSWFSSGKNPDVYRSQSEIIYQTEKIPAMVVMIRDGLESKLVARTKEELLKLPQTLEGREVLEKLNVTRFLEISGGESPLFKSTVGLLKGSGEKRR
ncbi:MAG TPA: phosphate/phosphite/phosphonate ABC transporter substrate-binding protein [Acidobacteriota bacterium]|jgi:phosphonate transport system substrate-binding protein